ncbi:class I SAM-dependent methyltransferase [Nanoarchaeota archaeon]
MKMPIKEQTPKEKWESFYENNKVSRLPWGNRPDREIKQIVRDLKKEKNYQKLKILDLGCGDGKNTAFLEKNGFNVTGIDISETAIRLAEKKCKSSKLFVGDALELLFKDNEFDILIDIGCYHSILPNKRRKYLSEIDRVLKNDGKIFLRCFSDKNDDYEGIFFSNKNQLTRLFGLYFDFNYLNDIKFEKKKGFFISLQRRKEKKLEKLNFDIPKNCEKAIWVKDLIQLKGKLKIDNKSHTLLDSFERIYFGDEFCQRLIPSKDEMLFVLDLCKQKNKKLTFVTPFLTEKYFQAYIGILRLISINMPNAEVIVNDFGLLNRIVGDKLLNHLKLSLGRLLVEQKKGPRTELLKGEIPRKAYDYFKQTNVENSVLQEFLKQNRVNRIELDNVVQGINLDLRKSGLKSSLHLPYVYTTTTRLCLSANCDKLSKRKHITVDDCRADCMNYSFVLDNITIPHRLILKGNTQYYINEKLPKNLDKLNVDRIVISYI